MKKYIAVFLMATLFTVGTLFSQATVYKTSSGNITFVSETEFEKFSAVNNQVTAAISSQGKVQFKAPVNSFDFEKKLMQTHFQENYMESATFPNGVFKGQIEDLKSFNLAKSGTYSVSVKGTLEIHGVTKEVVIPGKIVVDGDQVTLKSNFAISCAEYGVKIPKNNVNQISDIIKISVSCSLSK